MLLTRHQLTRIGVFFSIACLAVACAGRAYLMVDYAVPEENQLLQGLTVGIAVTDARAVNSVMTPVAAEQFPQFAQRYSLAWQMPGQQRILAGEHDLTNAMREAFKKRLTRMGATVTLIRGDDIPVLAISITSVVIDLKERNWVVDLSYRAELQHTPKPSSKETVRASAKRLRIIGRKGADQALSNIFSDAVNRLDLIKLFTEAGLKT